MPPASPLDRRLICGNPPRKSQLLFCQRHSHHPRRNTSRAADLTCGCPSAKLPYLPLTIPVALKRIRPFLFMIPRVHSVILIALSILRKVCHLSAAPGLTSATTQSCYAG